MRSKTTLAVLAGLAALALACGGGSDDVAGPGAQDNGAAPAAGAKKDGKRTIVLEVTGPKKADITYGLNADQSQDNGAELPWKKELSSGEALLLPSVVAQSKGSSEITCKITIDGKVVKTNSSKGEFAVVTCTADNL